MLEISPPTEKYCISGAFSTFWLNECSMKSGLKWYSVWKRFLYTENSGPLRLSENETKDGWAPESDEMLAFINVLTQKKRDRNKNSLLET